MTNSVMTDTLNSLLGSFWTGTVQHQTHLNLLKAWGLSSVAKAMEGHIADEPATLQNLLTRLLDLGGAPAFHVVTPVFATNVRELLNNDLAVQRQARPILNAAAEAAAAVHDATTKNLIESILADEEEHLSWLELELQLLDRLGEQLYFACRISS